MSDINVQELATKVVEELKKSPEKLKAFPHEIGCFLGYPAEDVRGFIEDIKPCKLVGTWKVYGNEEMAKHLFQIYEKCTYAYLEHFEKGMSLEQLVRFV